MYAYVSPPKAWAQICYEYENTDRPVEEICAEHEISAGTLRDRMRRWGWKRRRRPVPKVGPPRLMAPTIELTATDVAALTAPHPDDEKAEAARKYLAAWEEFATEAGAQDSGSTGPGT